MAKYPAAFINMLAESNSSKKELIYHLQRTWDDLCDKTNEVRALRTEIQRLKDKYGDACD